MSVRPRQRLWVRPGAHPKVEHLKGQRYKNCNLSKIQFCPKNPSYFCLKTTLLLKGYPLLQMLGARTGVSASGKHANLACRCIIYSRKWLYSTGPSQLFRV